MDEQNERQPEVSVVILAGNRTRRLERLLSAAERIAPKTEVILVCSPLEADQPEPRPGGIHVTIADADCSLNDRRIIGGTQSTGSVLLFLEDRMFLSTECLRRYVASVKKGKDIVLTEYTGITQTPRTMAYQLLNHVSGRSDLHDASLCELPFAINRTAWEMLKFAMASPPIAQAQAIVKELSLGAIRLPGKAPLAKQVSTAATPDASGDSILWEHTKAINLLLQGLGSRGGMWDGNRYRPLLQVPGRLHFRTVFRTGRNEWQNQQGGGRGEKRKAKRTNSRKKK
jgi:hypothetical protein